LAIHHQQLKAEAIATHTPLMSAGILLWLNNEPDRANTHASFRERDAWAEQTVLRNTSVLNIGVCSDVTHKIVSITKLKKNVHIQMMFATTVLALNPVHDESDSPRLHVCVCERERDYYENPRKEGSRAHAQLMSNEKVTRQCQLNCPSLSDRQGHTTHDNTVGWTTTSASQTKNKPV
jgi:hypothetical protein